MAKLLELNELTGAGITDSDMLLVRDVSAEEEKKATVETVISIEKTRAESAEEDLQNEIGTLTNLTTTAKSDLVSAVNELDSDIGDKSALATDSKTNLVASINEIDSNSDANTANIGIMASLTTDSNNDLVSAINEVDSHADTNAGNISTIIGNDTGKSMREVAKEVSATVYTPQGSSTFANLPQLSSDSVKIGYVYDVTDAFTTTSDFKEGAGIEVPAGTNIVVADVGGTKKWDLLGFNLDLTPYQKKNMSSSVTVDRTEETTVEGAIGALAGATVKNADSLPAAGRDYLGKVYFYTGPDTDSLTCGSAYRCAYDEESQTYSWEVAGGAGGNGTVLRFDTMSDWETARLIPKGARGHIPDNALVIIGDSSGGVSAPDAYELHVISDLWYRVENGKYYYKPADGTSLIEASAPGGAVWSEKSHEPSPIASRVNGYTRRAIWYDSRVSGWGFIADDYETSGGKEDMSGIGVTSLTDEYGQFHFCLGEIKYLM